MKTLTLTEIMEDMVERCRIAGDPIPGLFFFLPYTNAHFQERHAYFAAMASLLTISVRSPDDWFRVHTLDEIEQAWANMGVVSTPLSMGGPLRGNPVFPFELPKDLVPEGWSVAAWMYHAHGYDLMLAYLDGVQELMPNQKLPGLKNPLAMPITEDFVVGGGINHPLGQWLPAIRAPASLLIPLRQHHTSKRAGLTEKATKLWRRLKQWFNPDPIAPRPMLEFDLLDMASIHMSASIYSDLCQRFIAHVNENNAVKAGYLARQAVHVFDTANDDFNRLAGRFHESPLKEAYCLQTLENSAAAGMISSSMLYGASITPAAWAGTYGRERMFGDASGDTKELVYAVVCTADPLLDAQMASTLTRMHKEGHDVRIQYRSQASDPARQNRSVLPLHVCAWYGMTRSIAALLKLGADPTALVYTSKGAFSLQDAADKHPSTSEEVMHTVYAFEARQKARDILDEMQLDAPPPNFFKLA